MTLPYLICSSNGLWQKFNVCNRLVSIIHMSADNVNTRPVQFYWLFTREYILEKTYGWLYDCMLACRSAFLFSLLFLKKSRSELLQRFCTVFRTMAYLKIMEVIRCSNTTQCFVDWPCNGQSKLMNRTRYRRHCWEAATTLGISPNAKSTSFQYNPNPLKFANLCKHNLQDLINHNVNTFIVVRHNIVYTIWVLIHINIITKKEVVLYYWSSWFNN